MASLSMYQGFMPALPAGLRFAFQADSRFAFQAGSPADALRAGPLRAVRNAPAVRPVRRTRNGGSLAAAIVPAGLAGGLIVWFGACFVPAALTFAHVVALAAG